MSEQDLVGDLAVINTSQIRKGVPEKATGQAKYTADLSLPNMLIGALLQSPYAHARIVNIDASRARKLNGVKLVLTGKDVTQMKFGHSPARFDETALRLDTVNYIGDQVAAVAAVDEQTAKEAVDLIKVEYEELPAVLDPFQAMQEGAPVIHPEYPRNICQEVHNGAGDTARGFEQSYLVRTDRFMNRKTDGVCMEPHACLATFDLSGRLTVWTSTQVSHYVHRCLSMVLEIPIEKVRVIAPNVGGGFGVKASASYTDVVTGLLAMRSGQPVKLVLDREQVFFISRARHQYYHEMKIGVSRDGKIQAHEHFGVLDGGAYSSLGIITVYYNGSMLHAPYNIPAMKYDGYRVYTNKPASGALRGHGAVSNRACFEAQLDLVAKELGMDPVEFRLKNTLERGSTTLSGYHLSTFSSKECLEAAAADAGWKEKRGKLPAGKGIGAACSYFVTGAGAAIYRTDIPHSTVLVRVAEDGRGVTVHSGANEIGQGSDTVWAMITAEVLGLSPDDITVISGDTGLCPIDLGAYSSRQTLMTGNATKQAAEIIRQQLLDRLAKDFDMPASAFTFRGGLVHGTEKNAAKTKELRDRYISEHRGFRNMVKDGPLTFQEVARWAFSKQGTILGVGTYLPPDLQYSKDWKGSVVGASPAYSTQSCVAQVTVDMETGQLTIDKLTLAHDCGTAINRQAVEGQLEGSMVHGLSEALFEELIFDAKGRNVNTNLGDYKIPTALDVPDLSSIPVESYEPNGPYGAKEAGEGTILPIIPAIINAVQDACGVAIMDLPITSEKIYMALQAKKASGPGTYVYKPSAYADKVIDQAIKMNAGT
jgi:4-hydroxybenzoyl-CoA reductase alpha subunit